MICKQQEGGWDIIFQRAHALLAAQLAEHWQARQRPQRWLETLTAIAQHDNGWQEWESGDRVTEEGKPRDFTQMPLSQVAVQGERVVTRAWHQSLWSGLVVSRHVSHLYESRRGEYAALDRLLDEQNVLRGLWREWLGASQDAVDEAYSLLLWADSLSLLLCRDELPSAGERVAVGEGQKGQQYELERHRDGSLSLSPWPYALHRFHVAVDVHHLDQTRFDGDAALANALRRATVTRKRWELWTK